jgi:hydroxyethylthiazole kinase-like uncharacterized protein yjeF
VIDAYRAADVRAAEEPLLATERAFEGGLMHRAATALAALVVAELRERRGGAAGASVVGLVGRGNNGGDTLHALAALRRAGVRAVAVAAGPVHEAGLADLIAAGGQVLAVAPDGPGTSVWLGDAVAEAFAADVLLDGLLGTGARGGLRDDAARVVELLDGLTGQVGHGPLVVAVDVPSGVGVDDGTVPGPVLAADVTVTFGVAKPALLLPPAAHRAGRVEVVDLGLGPVLAEHGVAPTVSRLGAADVGDLWPVPGTEAHKYTRGVLGVVAGSEQYPGAAVLTVAGAQGAGAGLVRYVGPRRAEDLVLASHPEVVLGSGQAQAWVVGPGLDDAALAAARGRVAAAVREGVPVVVDAGALQLLPDTAPSAVLTPHAGELARLLVARGEQVTRAEVEAEPLRWAQRAHEVTGAVVLLKGATTLVVGAGRVLAQADGTPWLATAGAGDVLAGVLGALLAGVAARDGHVDSHALVTCAAAAAGGHGRAAAAASNGGPVTASQVAGAVPGVVAELVSP